MKKPMATIWTGGTVVTLSEIAEALSTAARQGAESDEPEGARFITMSDTLARNIAAGLRNYAQAIEAFPALLAVAKACRVTVSSGLELTDVLVALNQLDAAHPGWREWVA